MSTITIPHTTQLVVPHSINMRRFLEIYMLRMFSLTLASGTFSKRSPLKMSSRRPSLISCNCVVRLSEYKFAGLKICTKILSLYYTSFNNTQNLEVHTWVEAHFLQMSYCQKRLLTKKP